MPPHRNVLFITLDQWRGDCLSALGHPGGRDAAPRRPGAAAVSCSPTTGPTRHRAGRRGPACTPVPTSTATARSSTAPPWTPASPTWRSWPAGAGYDPVLVRVHGHLGRSAHGAARRPETVQLRGRAAGVPCPDRGPVGTGQPGLGPLARRAGGRRPGQPARTVRAHGGVPGRRRPRVDLGPGALSRRTLPDELRASDGGRVAGAARRRRRSSCTPRSSAPIRRGGTRSGYHDRYSAEAVGPFVGCADAGGGGGHPPARRVGHGAPVGRRAPRTSGSAGSCAPPTTVRSARWTTGWRRSSTTWRRAAWPNRPWWSSRVTTARWAATTGCSRSSGYWDESYHVPADRRGPAAEADGGRGHGRRGGDRVGGRAADHL